MTTELEANRLPVSETGKKLLLDYDCSTARSVIGLS